MTKYTDINISELQVLPFKGGEKKFAKIKNPSATDQTLTLQLPKCSVVFEPSNYNSMSVRMNHVGFQRFLNELQLWLIREVDDAPDFDVGIKEDTSGKYDPLFRLKITDETSVYDHTSKRSTKDILKRGIDVHILCQVNCLYCINGRYGVSWKAVQIKAAEPLSSPEPSDAYGNIDFLD